MAKTALNQLQEQIEVLRREAYAAGYAAAMQAIRDFSQRPAGGTAATFKPERAPKAAPAKTPARRGRPPGAVRPAVRARPLQRGTNARLVTEVMKASGSDFVRPATIRAALQKDKGAVIAFTSIRHALGQLQAQGHVEPSADGKSWRYIGP
jgi:hypothetical protein